MFESLTLGALKLANCFVLVPIKLAYADSDCTVKEVGVQGLVDDGPKHAGSSVLIIAEKIYYEGREED